MEQIGGNHLVDGDEPSAMNTLSEVGKLHRHLQPHEETTEWDDILRKHGIKPPDPVKEENKRIEAEVKRIVEEEAANYDPHTGKTVEELEIDLEDPDEDEERMLQAYRDMRLAEMKAASRRPEFGELMHIAANEWQAQVTNAPPDVFVVVHLHQEHVEECQLLNQILRSLAPRFRRCKFCYCKASDAVKGFPDEMCPTLFLYKAGDIISQPPIINGSLAELSGAYTTADEVEWLLAKSGALETELEEKPQSRSAQVSFQLRR